MRYLRTRWLWAGVLVAASLTGLAVAGCDTPEAIKARRTREEAMARSLDMIGSLDKRRPEQLAYTSKIMSDRVRKDDKAIRRDVDQVGKLFDEEFENWKAKEPGLRRAIEHQFEGDDASIRRTAPNFVY